MKFITLILLAFSSHLFGQPLSGIIKDNKDKLIDMAYIEVKNKNIHSHSNSFGEFTIYNLNVNDTLIVSHLGYETKQIPVVELDKKVTIILNEKLLSIEEIVITSNINAMNIISGIDLRVTPVNNSQELMRKVPGLFIGQHAGGGKAEQIFLRGFDIDHGTDINISVDDMPVNMVSHAHGQGYADLHFLIPETVENIDFGKGTYYASKGDFTTAGYVAFKTKERIDDSQIKLELGQFNTKRALAMFNLLNQDKHAAYVAGEFFLTDGPFESSQNFDRKNILGKYVGQLPTGDKISLMASWFDSKWDASGQIPQRAVDKGLITRFGAIDDTEGGFTSRTNFRFGHQKNLSKTSTISSSIFYNLYDFELYSNFTFFLEDSINGDQIKQKESRKIFGINSEFAKTGYLNDNESIIKFGFQLRNDISDDNELSQTINRSTLKNRLKYGDVNQTSLGIYGTYELTLGKLTINPSLRFDQFIFKYYDKIQNTGRSENFNQSILSPKLNLIYNQNRNLQYFVKAGRGFHSNDTRVIIDEKDKKILPAAYGVDAGFIYKPFKNLLVNSAYWYLFLQQEFVYVGDAGIVEAGGETKRQGFDFGLRYEPVKRLHIDADLTYTIARALGEEVGNDFIPLAPDFTFTGGLNYIAQSGIYGGLKYRYLDNRPANEDNSIVALGYSVFDFNLGYQYKKIDVALNIQNLLNTEWNETQFATESRLSNEAEPVEEIHFTPGTPFFAKLSLAYRF